jgi:hypothetical protein
MWVNCSFQQIINPLKSFKMRLNLIKGNHSVDLWDVASFNVCNCELSITFFLDHTYRCIDDICAILEEIGIPVGNFYFKGLSSYDFDEDDWGRLIPRKEYIEDGETSILCMIPENIRDEFTATAFDNKGILPY